MVSSAAKMSYVFFSPILHYWNWDEVSLGLLWGGYLLSVHEEGFSARGTGGF